MKNFKEFLSEGKITITIDTDDNDWGGFFV